MIWQHTKKVLAGLAIVSIAGLSLTAAVTKIRHGELLSVQTGSMAPALNRGDLVSVKNVPAGELAVGDIITFINPANKKQTITHRITELPSYENGRKFVTKGDANPYTDGPIEAKSIIGKTTYSIPKVGYAVDWVRHPLGLIFIIYLPALAIIISELKRLAAYYKSQEKYMLPWRRKRVEGRRGRRTAMLAAKLLLPVILIPAVFVLPAWAALSTKATLTDNTISTEIVQPPPPSPDPCNSGNSTTNISVTGNGRVRISNSNNQTATSGNAMSTGGGNATSGNATNCNSTNINVNVSP